MGLTTLFIIRQLTVTLTALIRNTPVDTLEVSLWITDLTLSPVWLIGGWLLLRRTALGYVVGAGLLLLYNMLFMGLIMFFPSLYRTGQINAIGMIMILVMCGITLVPFVLYVRGVIRS